VFFSKWAQLDIQTAMARPDDQGVVQCLQMIKHLRLILQAKDLSNIKWWVHAAYVLQSDKIRIMDVIFVIFLAISRIRGDLIYVFIFIFRKVQAAYRRQKHFVLTTHSRASRQKLL